MVKISENINYTVKYITKSGGHTMWTCPSILAVEDRIKKLFKQRIEATAYFGDTVIGRVWQDNSQLVGWNYYCEQN